MAEGDKKRRSSRLLALEETKCERAVLALPVDFRQKKVDGRSNLQKRGRKRIRGIEGEVQGLQDVGLKINGNLLNSTVSSRNATDRIIGYILDMLEVKDTHELFSMPDNLQTYDYEESMKQPGDFATLRQKYTDKMYATLDHFENDVLTVFHKAIDSNAPNSIPFREAMTLRDHAKQIFQSLKNNLAYAELELSEWHQHYFRYKRRALRSDSNIGNSSTAPQREYNARVSVSTGIKQHIGTSNSAGVRRNVQSTSSSRARNQRATHREHEQHPQLPEEQRRYTYKPGNDSKESLFTMFCNEPKTIVYNNSTLSYQESLRQFVKDAGPAAKLIAENKCHEYYKRVQAQSIWRPSPFGTQSKIGAQHILSQNIGSSSSSAPNNDNPNSTSINDQNASNRTQHQACQLHTDELLTLFSLIGTPEFSQRSSASSSKEEVNKSSIINDSVIWQPRSGGSKSWKEDEREGSSNVSAGLYQNKRHGLPPKPPTNLNMFHGKK
ncbi:uncharacterized protein A4U43_UnF4010 [Asparagus officinalis]|uniref:Bromo domain-containing protein n=1 Tax=Asparagus officinalis TaxID=4686 RepID=A0A1R3L708_ASPOF|nr:uncharacterized protein A4U43_UnF4010 [Asparagus officinalis]